MLFFKKYSIILILASYVLYTRVAKIAGLMHSVNILKCLNERANLIDLRLSSPFCDLAILASLAGMRRRSSVRFVLEPPFDAQLEHGSGIIRCPPDSAHWGSVSYASRPVLHFTQYLCVF
jgi:hypothetical protein